MSPSWRLPSGTLTRIPDEERIQHMYGPKTVPFQPEVVEVVGKEHRRLGAERKLLFTFCLLPAPITCRSARKEC